MGISQSRAARQTEGLAYFSGVRRDIVHLLPDDCRRLLELGCGAGLTLKHLKDEGLCRWASGVELNVSAAEVAKRYLDRVWSGDIESMTLDIEPGSLDAILALDVLEHLVDPWAVVERLHRLLKPGGVLIAAIPNIRNIKTLWRLATRGDFNYQDQGIFDRTHLRFFVRETIVELLEYSGLKVDVVEPIPKLKPWKNKWIYNKLTFGALTDLYPTGYRVRAVRGISRGRGS